MINTFWKAVFLVELLASPAPTASSQVAQGSVPSVREWISLRAADSPNLSPDGSKVAFQVRTPDWGTDRFDDEVWVASVQSGEQRQLTNAKGSSWSPRWSPDGRRLAFFSSRSGATQVYAVSPPDTAASQMTHAERGVDDFRWSPDGRWLAYTASALVSQPSEPAEFHLVGNDSRWSTRLWVMDASGGPAVGVTDSSAFAVDDISWAPDSRSIAFHASAVGAPHPYWTYDIYVVTVNDRKVRKLAGNPGPDFFPIWSPDGKQIAYRTYAKHPDEQVFTHSMGMLAVVPSTGGRSTILTGNFDEQVTPVAWVRSGIYFSARQRTYQHLFKLDPATRAIQRVTEPFESVNTGFSFDRDMSRMAFVRQDAKRYQEVFVGPVHSSATAKQITSYGDQLDRWRIATREVVTWKSRDGTPIEGILLKPAGFDPARKYPLVVIVHGGPLDVDQATIGRDMPYAAELFAARGALVLRPNYRGSVGYGAGFRALLAGKLGIPEYEDVVSGIDAIGAGGFVDTARLGLMGWSHGGYIAAIASTYGDRFKAISMGAGVSEFISFYTTGAGLSLPPDSTRPLPWADSDFNRRATPLTYVSRARTPTLIQHGENDPVAPISSANALHRALQERGVPTRMMVLKGAGHLPNGLKQFEAVVEQNLEWFERWLWRDSLP